MNPTAQRGFTLVEVAIAVAIVSLMMVGAIYTLNAQIDQRAYEETRNRLNHARELLLAYAVVNGRMPCPARSTSAGLEVRNAGGECKNASGTIVEDHYGGNLAGGGTGGFLPAATLGFGHVDANGFALDGWNNPIRYALAKTVTGCAGTPTLPALRARREPEGKRYRVPAGRPGRMQVLHRHDRFELRRRDQ